MRYSYNKFKRKFDKFLQKRNKLLGEIYLSELQYEALIGIVKNVLITKIRNNSINSYDIVISVAMVQIGIREYTEGNYWDRFCSTLNLELNTNQKRDLGQLFLETLNKYNLFIYRNANSSRNDYVTNILIHCIIPNYYIADFFDFVYTFYDINLGRNISSRTSSDLRYLTDFINDSLSSNKDEVRVKVKGFSNIYRLRKSTKLYISFMDRKARFLIRRLIKLIDAKYWDGSLPKMTRNRITQQFLIWANKSERFLTDVQVATISKKRGNKQFISPYFTYSFKDKSVNIVIPPQKFRTDEFNEVVKAEIRIEDNILEDLTLDTFSIIGGYKTEEKVIKIHSNNIFDKITVNFKSGIDKKFNLPKRDYIIFDEKGISTNIHSGTIYILCKNNLKVESDDLIEKNEYKDFTIYYLILDNSSIIFINNTPFSPSGHINYGIQKRGLLKGIQAISEDKEILPVYISHPNILFRSTKDNIDGIGVIVNKQRYRLKEIAEKVYLKIFEVHDGNNGQALQINFSNFIGDQSMLVEFYIDIPGSSGNKNIDKYILLPKLNYKFNDSPYIFTDKAVIEINNIENLKALEMQKIEKGHVYGIGLTPEKKFAKFNTNLNNKIYSLLIEIPYLRWKFDDKEWEISHEDNLWYKDIGDELFIDLPGVDYLMLIINDDPETIQYGEYTNGLFKFNLRRYLGYFRNDIYKYNVKLKYYDNNVVKYIELMSIISSCITKYAHLSFDPKRKILSGSFEIIGKGKCVLDIIHKETDEKVVENIDISNGNLSIQGEFKNGIHKVVIYSIEEDEFGFNEYKRKIFKKDIDTTNPYDLSEKEIRLRGIKIRIFKLGFSKKYIIGNIKKSDVFGTYYGEMFTIENGEKVSWNKDCPVKITFLDKNTFSKANINIKYDGEWTVLLYDYLKKELVIEEDYTLPKKIAYKRYEFLSEEDTEFPVIIQGRRN